MSRYLFPTLAALPLTLAACATDPGAPGTGPATIAVSASVAGAGVAAVVIDVSGVGIATPLVFNLPVVNDLASGILTIPAGADRLFQVRAYDTGGVQTHAGSTTVNVQPGATLTLSITLDQLTGDVDLDITLGYVTVTVTPPAGPIPVGATEQLTSTITDEHGVPVAGAPAWATADPSVATVDGTGLVTAVGTGSTVIAATFGGAAGHAAVTVTAAP
jgi:hypothetical protein